MPMGETVTDHDHEHHDDGDDDEIDGCAVDFEAHAVDELTASLLPLFPKGLDTPDLEQLAEGYNALGALDA